MAIARIEAKEHKDKINESELRTLTLPEGSRVGYGVMCSLTGSKIFIISSGTVRFIDLNEKDVKPFEITDDSQWGYGVSEDRNIILTADYVLRSFTFLDIKDRLEDIKPRKINFIEAKDEHRFYNNGIYFFSKDNRYIIGYLTEKETELSSMFALDTFTQSPYSTFPLNTKILWITLLQKEKNYKCIISSVTPGCDKTKIKNSLILWDINFVDKINLTNPIDFKCEYSIKYFVKSSDGRYLACLFADPTKNGHYAALYEIDNIENKKPVFFAEKEIDQLFFSGSDSIIYSYRWEEEVYRVRNIDSDQLTINRIEGLDSFKSFHLFAMEDGRILVTNISWDAQQSFKYTFLSTEDHYKQALNEIMNFQIFSSLPQFSTDICSVVSKFICSSQNKYGFFTKTNQILSEFNFILSVLQKLAGNPNVSRKDKVALSSIIAEIGDLHKDASLTAVFTKFHSSDVSTELSNFLLQVSVLDTKVLEASSMKRV